MTTAPITLQALNRATLARQLLLDRQTIGPVEAVERVLGLQAQLARPPFIGLWSRLADFERRTLIEALHEKRIVRGTSMRGTLHLLSAKDFLQFRQTFQPMLDAGMAGILQQRKATIELEPVIAIARAAFDAGPHTFEAVRDLLQARFPEADERAMGYAARTRLPLVQVPTEAIWGFPGTSAFTSVQAWLGQAPDGRDRIQDLIRRYLAAFGPASVKDMERWSGLGKLKGAFDGLRDELVVFKDGKREFFDLPDAPRPDPDVPAPVRFLPDFDSVVLAHEDRTRVVSDEHRAAITQKANLRILPSFLVDGRVAGTWRLEGTKTKAVLVVVPFVTLAKADRDALGAEAERLVRFAEPEAKTTDVKFE